jgi:serine phosphatase RsbU (regulator of sigma subunit)
MFARFDWNDRRAAIVGALVLVTVALVYPLVADATARPLAAFVLPCLVTAVLGGWRPTLLVGITSFSVAIVVGLLGPLDIEALLARWIIIGVGVLIGAVGAAVRQRQSGRLADLNETMSLRAAFERALAPAPITPDGYVAVARYRPAESRLNLGGDFLEAVALEDGRLAVLIGDVCGHGPREAAFGTALRAGWKAIALSGKHDPADWVDALDASFFRDGRIDTYVTLCTGYLDVITGVSRLVNVGHPPPVLLEHPVRVLDLPPTPPLGLGLNDNWTAIEVPWAGQPMLLYTDGLVENPNRQGKPRRWGELGLLAWLDAHPQTTALTDLADRLLQSATTGRTIRDDIAILIIAGDR